MNTQIRMDSKYQTCRPISVYY